MADTSSDLRVFICDACGTAVFTPARINGGVCTQQSRGCGGELALLSDRYAAMVRALVARKGLREQPWLTLIPKAASSWAVS